MQVIDQNWTDHLSQREDLRQIVGIRGYGQRAPLNEYKSESFLLFETLLNKFREDNSLMTQQWVMEPKKKVKNIIDELGFKDLKIVDFYRIKIGD